LGGFLIGIVESFIKGADTMLGPIGFNLLRQPLQLATFSDAFTFVLLIVILLFKPTGLFGEKASDKA
jgi:branched-chain amino acid transport system permease protein